MNKDRAVKPERDEERRRRLLIEGLVGDEHKGRWLNQPMFRASVEQFASLLVIFMRGLAVETDEQEADFQARLKLLTDGAPLLHNALEPPNPQPQREGGEVMSEARNRELWELEVRAHKAHYSDDGGGHYQFHGGEAGYGIYSFDRCPKPECEEARRLIAQRDPDWRPSSFQFNKEQRA